MLTHSSHVSPRGARRRSLAVLLVAATVVALVFSLRSAILEGMARTADWVPLVESVINDLVFAAIAVVFL